MDADQTVRAVIQAMGQCNPEGFLSDSGFDKEGFLHACQVMAEKIPEQLEAGRSLTGLMQGVVETGYRLRAEQDQRYRLALERLQNGPDTLTPDGLQIVLDALNAD